MRHQFGLGRHVDAVNVGVAHRRRSRGQVHLHRPGVACHLHNLLRRGATHDGVVHQQHFAALELAADGVELLAHRLFARALARHDEGAAHVAVFDETLAVRDAQQLRKLHGAGAAGFRNGDDGIDLARRHRGDDALGQCLAHVQARLVDGDAVHHRIGPRQVHVLEHAGVQLRVLSALLRLDAAVGMQKHRLARRNVALQQVAGALQRHGFAGQHHRAVAATAHAQRANAKRVAERQQAVARDQRDHGIRALDALVHRAHGLEDVLAAQRRAAAGPRQLVRQHVEQHLGIALGVGVAVVGLRQLAAQRVRVGQVAVVHHDDAEGGIHVERLGLFLARGIARRGVAHLAQADIARQCPHVARAEDVAHHALGFVHEELALLLGDDARGILPPVLQQQQRVIDQLVHGRMTDNANDSTHRSGSIRLRDKPAGITPVATVCGVLAFQARTLARPQEGRCLPNSSGSAGRRP